MLKISRTVLVALPEKGPPPMYWIRFDNFPPPEGQPIVVYSRRHGYDFATLRGNAVQCNEGSIYDADGWPDGWWSLLTRPPIGIVFPVDRASGRSSRRCPLSAGDTTDS